MHFHVLCAILPLSPRISLKHSCYVQLNNTVDQFPKYHTKILLGDFNEKLKTQIFCNRKMGMKIYMKNIILTVFRVVNIVTQNNVIDQCTMFPHQNIQIHFIGRFAITFIASG